MVQEGAALEPLPWEAKGLDGLELPKQTSRLSKKRTLWIAYSTFENAALSSVR
jgi:hypothetical protein